MAENELDEERWRGRDKCIENWCTGLHAVNCWQKSLESDRLMLFSTQIVCQVADQKF